MKRTLLLTLARYPHPVDTGDSYKEMNCSDPIIRDLVWLQAKRFLHARPHRLPGTIKQTELLHLQEQLRCLYACARLELQYA
jgi:hypothetical protein